MPVIAHRAPAFDRHAYVWTTRRAEMVDGHAVAERMADDILGVARGRGADGRVYEADLINLGWTARQIRDHGTKAKALARSEELYQ